MNPLFQPRHSLAISGPLSASAVITMFVIMSTAPSVAAPSQEGVVVEDQWFYASHDDENFPIVVVVRNRSPRYQGDITATLRFFDHEDAYKVATVKPDKTVLAPGEETTIFISVHADHERLHAPTHIQTELSSATVEPSAYPYLQNPTVLASRFEGAGLAMEVMNSSSRYYRAIQGNQAVPFKAVIVLYKEGRVSGAQRVRVDRGWPMGHVAPGQVVEFHEWVDMHDGYDDYRVFFTVEPLPDGVFPKRLDVRIDRWRAVSYDWCGPLGGCRAVEFAARVDNSSDGSVNQPYVYVVARDKSGRFIQSRTVPIYDPLTSGGTVRWQYHLYDLDLERSHHGRFGVGDVVCMSAHAMVLETTTDPEFAMPPVDEAPCASGFRMPWVIDLPLTMSGWPSQPVLPPPGQ